MAIGRPVADLIESHWLRIGGYWYPRGGIPIDVFGSMALFQPTYVSPGKAFQPIADEASGPNAIPCRQADQTLGEIVPQFLR